MYTANKVEDEELKAKLPEPSGYRLLIAVPEVSEKTEGGVYMPDQLKKAEETASVIGFVIKAGPEAYSDANKFPSGPWCKEGDWVIFGRYAGARLTIDGGEVRILNDDEIVGTVNDPEDILHM